MEPLFSVHTTNSLEEYKRWNFTLNKPRLIILCILVLLLVPLMVYSAFSYDYGSIWLAVFSFLLTIGACAFFVAAVNQNIRKSYYSNRALQKCPAARIDFFNNYFEIKNERSYSKYFYEDIYRIVETKTNFYIMTASNSGVIIIKQNCLPELISFIQGLKSNIK